MIIPTIAILIGMVIAYILGSLYRRYRDGSKAIVDTWDKAFPSLEKAMKEGEKDGH